MTIMDPWQVPNNTEDAIITTVNSKFGLEFEDNFQPSVTDPLPDSEQYLAVLEEKLRRIRNDPNILKQLAEKRAACMQELLQNSQQFEDNPQFDDPLNNSQILRTLLPQKQALNQGEIVELVKYDQLSNESESD